MPSSENRKSFTQAYNAQTAVNEQQVIVATAVSNQIADSTQLPGMMAKVRENTETLPDDLTADYTSDISIVHLIVILVGFLLAIPFLCGVNHCQIVIHRYVICDRIAASYCVTTTRSTNIKDMLCMFFYPSSISGA